MTVPSWLGHTLAVVMIATALYCAARLTVPRLWNRPSEHDVDAVHLLMGAAMAGMLLPGLDFLAVPVWESVFAVAALWFAMRIPWEIRSAGADASAAPRSRSISAALTHHLPHLVACCAMLDMYFAPGAAAPAGSGDSSGGMSGMAMPGTTSAATNAVTARYPTIALALAVFLVIYAIVVVDRTAAFAPHTQTEVATTGQAAIGCSSGTLAPLWSRQVADCCHIAMSVTMAYLLVAML
ncbi:MAG TPA: DUF5134 domain-containing protein [Actinocrinis sp.]